VKHGAADAGCRAAGCHHRSGGSPADAPGRGYGTDCSSGAELRRASRKAGCDAQTVDAETEQRQRCQRDGQHVLQCRLAAEPLGKLAEQVGADADDDGKHQDLDARGDCIA
jgi:hypothetical protein